MSREELEKALDSGKLEILMGNGKYWKTRRDGKTKLWKTRPGLFKIPIKYGFNTFGYLTELDLMNFDKYYRISK